MIWSYTVNVKSCLANAMLRWNGEKHIMCVFPMWLENAMKLHYNFLIKEAQANRKTKSNRWSGKRSHIREVKESQREKKHRRK